MLTAFALPSAVAHAAEPSPEVLGKITKLNKKAIEAYQKEDFDGARDLLKQALDACNAAGLQKHPITARTEIHIGVLLIGGLKQHDAGIKHFQKALQIQPDIQLTKTIATPELQDAFEEAVLGAGGGGDEGGGNKRRPPSDDDSGGAGAGATEGGEAGGDEDRPPPRRKVATVKKKAKKRSGDDEGEEGGEKKDEDEDEGGAAEGGKIYVGLLFGTGFGVASGTGETTGLATPHKLSGAGFALAQLVQIAPEVGYFWNPDLMISLQLRYQIITGTNPPPGSTEPSSAIAGFVRGTYFAGKSAFRPFFSVAVGGGTIRHAVVFQKNPVCGPMRNETCVDTFKGGPFLIGPGAGFHYSLGLISLVVQLNSQLGLPTFTFNLDIQGGLALRF